MSRRTRSRPTVPVEAGRPLRLEKALPFLLLVSAVCLFFWEIITGRGFLWEDILYQYYPFTFHLLRSLKSFSLPLWNPYMFGGMPFLADIQTQVFYPLNWLFVPFFTPDQRHVFWLVEFKCILHIFVGAISFYLLMRDQGHSSWSGLIAALSFAFGGFMVGHLIHLTIVSTFAWFPLVLLFFLRALRHGTMSAAAGGAVALGFANLAGHPQMSLHMVYALGLLFFVYIATNWPRERAAFPRRHVPLFLLMVVGGFALSAAAYIPACRLSGHTVRELLTYAESAEISLSPMAAITLFVPKFFGSVTGAGTDSVQYWGGPMAHFYWETALYLGIVPLLLAFYGAFASRSRMRWPFLVLAGAAILLALGRHTPLYRLAFDFLPGMDRFRIPARFVGLFGIAVAFLAGLGADALFNYEPRRPRSASFTRFLLVILASGGVFFALLASGGLNRLMPQLQNGRLYANALRQTGVSLAILVIAVLLIWIGFRRRLPASAAARVAAPLLVLLTFIDLFVFGHSFAVGTVAPEHFYPRNTIVSRLEAEKAAGPFRMNARRDNYMLLQRNEGLIWQLELLEGYTPLRLADVAAFNVPTGRRNDLMNVTYRIEVDSVHGRLEMVENPSALPRFWLADTCVVVPDRMGILSLLADSAFDYRRVPILEKEPSPRPQSWIGTANVGTVRLISRSTDRIELEADCSLPSLLMLSEVFYPEWRARVDGRPVEILRADYCLRCIPLSAGKHRVVLWYDAGPVVLGIVISALTAVGLVAVIMVGRRRSRGGGQS